MSAIGRPKVDSERLLTRAPLLEWRGARCDVSDKIYDVTAEWVQGFCMKLPHVTEAVQWEHSLVFKVGGKMFAVASLEPGRVWLSFKCSAEDFGELTERMGIIPAPYLARASWVGLEEENALNRAELAEYLQRAYDLVLAKLPRKKREALSGLS